MNHSIIKQVIIDQLEDIQSFQIIPRDYQFEKNANYILVGLRRGGKSTILYSLAKNLVRDGMDWSQICYLNFEDDRLLGFELKDFNDVIGAANELANGKTIIYFFDEIQNNEGWEHFARRMADHHHRVYISGSNARMLSNEMESVLGGRYLSKMIMPFSFREVLRFKKIDSSDAAQLSTVKSAQIRVACERYLHVGGLPDAQQMDQPREYIKSVYEKVILGDIGEREKIQNKMALRLMVKKIAEVVMHEISFSSLAGNVKAAGARCTTDTMIEYAGYAENAYLLFRTRNFFSKFSEKEGIPRFYFFDNGFLSLFLVNKDSALLENAVAVMLKRNCAEEIYYLKSSQTGVDIDFYLPESKTAIQVCYSLQDAQEREVRSFSLALKYSPELIQNMLIVTYEEEDMISLDEKHVIRVLPLWKFLLQEKTSLLTGAVSC
ncbi:MAG: ATP-binding protein [Lactimicrobium sp.]|jgi:predicted AAA+ superfamily ATPase|uniref:ATP-binding protein n=2 Tax=Lactimicrobium sp. TaxID=2563780 RepID=UPI002F35A36B